MRALRIPLLLLLLVAVPMAWGRDGAADGQRFAQAERHYRELAARGGWQPIPTGPSLHPGESSADVAAIRARLAATGDLLAAGSAAAPAEPDRYDDGLVAAVRAFQLRHGLAADGVVGARTRSAMNVPAAERIAQLDLNRQRAEHEAPPAGRWIRINVPEFRLAFLDGERRVLEMPVVVGRRDRRTPLFESAITWIVFHPTWTIPSKLAYEDVLPKVRRDPAYLAKNGIRLYESWRAGAPPLDPDWIDWADVGPAIKRLKLRQAPGASNPLGRIKFHMVNDHDIYLHDTNHPELMGRDRRDLSSGCIRVGDAQALVEEVLRDEPGWDAAKIAEVLRGGRTIQVGLRRPVPVRLVYQTSWVDTQGLVHFREDIYGVDARQVAELAAERRQAPALGDGRRTGVSPPAP